MPQTRKLPPWEDVSLIAVVRDHKLRSMKRDQHHPRKGSTTLCCAVAALTLPVLMLTGAGPVRALQVREFIVDPTPLVSLGSEELPSQQFLWIRDATVLEDGRVAVLDGASEEVRIFTTSGHVDGVFGGLGDGPGEYRGLVSLRQLPSSDLQVFDIIHGRLTTVSTDGAVVTTERRLRGLTARPRQIGRPFASGAVPYTQGTVGPLDPAWGVEGVRQDDLRAGLFTANGPEIVTTVSLGESYTVWDRGRGLTKPVPMSPQALVAFGAAVIVVGTTHSTEFRALDEDGSTVTVFRGSGTLEEPTRHDWELFEQAFLAENQSPPRIGGVPTAPPDEYRLPEELLSRAPRGRHKPLFDRAIMEEDDQALWLRQFDLQSPEATWQVVSGSGNAAMVTIPRTWEILEVGTSHVLIVRQDELGTESVHLHSLRR
jgi:hypothetical protein